MSGKATVTYFHHSGFSVAVGDTLMVFDYWRGENGEVGDTAALSENDFKGFDQVLFFVSHEHPDHYDRVIYDFEHLSKVRYIIADDMPADAKGDRIGTGETRRYGDVKVRAYGSTDLGVSFYINCGGLNIFFAGDLNLWHWREESTLRQITQAEHLYYACVEQMLGQPIDLCMFPVDPRMGGMYEAGANHFIMAMKPRVFIPMHWHGRMEVATGYARRCRTKYTEGLALTFPREKAEITFESRNLDIRVFPTEEKENMLKRKMRSNQAESVREVLSAFEESDPFAESDLPVEDMTE